MRTTLDRDSFILKFIAAGALLAPLGLAGCGKSNLYQYNAPAAIAIADFNGSGYPGIAVAQAQINQLEPQEQPGYVALVLQNPSDPGTFESSVHFAIQGNPSSIAVGEFTPGSVDLAVSNVNDNSVSVLMQTSPNSGTFKTAVNVPAGPKVSGTTFLTEDVAICDVNGDGHPDLVISYQLQQEVENILSGVGGGVNVMLQSASSPGTFGPYTNIGSTPTPSGLQYPNVSYGVACANLSGDATGLPDIVMTSFSGEGNYDPTALYVGGTVSIFFHDPANPGSFLPRVDISVPGALSKVVIADVNNDGLPDIIVADEGPDANSDGESGAAVLLQNPPATPGAQPTFAAPVYYPTNSAVGIAVGDLTGDGLSDIVVASSVPTPAEGGTGTINVLLNTPATPGVFQTAVSYAGLGDPVSVAIGSLDGKVGTLQDVAVADSTGAAVMMNESTAPGTLQAELLVGG